MYKKKIDVFFELNKKKLLIFEKIGKILFKLERTAQKLNFFKLSKTNFGMSPNSFRIIKTKISIFRKNKIVENCAKKKTVKTSFNIKFAPTPLQKFHAEKCDTFKGNKHF